MAERAAGPGGFRAGVVALLGPPNAGKSTLLNALVGEKLAIVTAKPQTTRSRILGVTTDDAAQIAWVDTPGLHSGSQVLNSALNEAVEQAVRDCELALLLVDLTRGWNETHAELHAALRHAGTPVIALGTKSDLVRERGGAEWPPPGVEGLEAALRVSARTRAGVPQLVQAVTSRLPESAPLYDPDTLTDRPLRWLAAELVREAMFEELEQELPYRVATEVTAFDESRPDLVTIRANLLVARDSQKRIVIGSGGEQIKRIGTRARREIEKLVGTRVHLDLWVKVDPRWLRNRKRIEELGYY